MTKRAASGHAGCASNLTYTSLRMRGGLARVRGRRGGGTGCFLFVCLFVAQHWFHAIHSQSPSRTLGQDTRDFASDFARDYTAYSRISSNANLSGNPDENNLSPVSCHFCI